MNKFVEATLLQNSGGGGRGRVVVHALGFPLYYCVEVKVNRMPSEEAGLQFPKGNG